MSEQKIMTLSSQQHYDRRIKEYISDTRATALPNPYPITINGHEYNGSEAINVDTIQVQIITWESGD